MNLIKSCKRPYDKAGCTCRHCDMYTDWVKTTFKDDPLSMAVFTQIYDWHLNCDFVHSRTDRNYIWGDQLRMNYSLCLFFPQSIADHLWQWIEEVLRQHPFLNDKFHKVPLGEVNVFVAPMREEK